MRQLAFASLFLMICSLTACAGTQGEPASVDLSTTKSAKDAYSSSAQLSEAELLAPRLRFWQEHTRPPRYDPRYDYHVSESLHIPISGGKKLLRPTAADQDFCWEADCEEVARVVRRHFSSNKSFRRYLLPKPWTWSEFLSGGPDVMLAISLPSKSQVEAFEQMSDAELRVFKLGYLRRLPEPDEGLSDAAEMLRDYSSPLRGDAVYCWVKTHPGGKLQRHTHHFLLTLASREFQQELRSLRFEAAPWRVEYMD